jgi:small subunit ribosomal protein S5
MARINPDTLDLKERIVRTNKVQKTTKGGRTMSWSTLVVVGDRNGYVGAGIGKARAIPDAIRKGTEDAKKQVIQVPLVNGTIPHEILAEHGASQVLLRPAAPGTGVVAGGAVRVILEEAGVQDVLAKSLGSNNPVNNAWATMNALRSLRTIEQVAALRGKTPEEVRRGAALGSGEVAAIRPAQPASGEGSRPATLTSATAGFAAAEAGDSATQTPTVDTFAQALEGSNV